MKFQDCFYSSGTVRQLSRKGKPWQGTLKYKDSNGDWKSVTKMLNDATGKKDAERLLKEWQEAMESRSIKSAIKNPKAIKKSLGKTVSETVREYLDLEYEIGELERSTYTQQMNVFEKRGEPYIGDIPFTELTKEQVHKWLSTLKEKYKWHSAYNVWSIVKKTYAYHLKEGDITYNPCFGVVLKDNEVHEKNILGFQDIENFIDEIRSYTGWSCNKAAFIFPLYTGMRTQEMCGLRWSDVNLPAAKLNINIAIGCVRDTGDTYIKKPKFNCSKRIIPLMPQAMEILKWQYNEQLKEYQKKHPEAKEVPESHYVFGEGDGNNYRSPRKLCSGFINFTKRKNIKGKTGKHLSLHDLRHTFATNAVASGMDVKSISSVIGHANAAMTLDVYAAADEDAIRSGMDKLGNYIEDRTETAGYVGL